LVDFCWVCAQISDGMYREAKTHQNRRW
jgi:hypothetical protein